MPTTFDIERSTKALIDSLKQSCGAAGLGNDGSEYKIIVQVFLYKYFNDKFGYEAKKSQSTANASPLPPMANGTPPTINSRPMKSRTSSPTCPPPPRASNRTTPSLTSTTP